MAKSKKLLSKDYELPEEISTAKRDLVYLHNIIKDMPGIIYWKDLSGHYLGCNQFAIDLMKKTGVIKNSDISEIIGKTDFDLFDEITAKQYQKNDKLVIKERKALTQEETVTLPDGEVRQQLSIKRPLYDENNDIVGVIGNTIDVTDKKKNEELERNKVIADETIRLLQLMSGAIAHEIRNPLATIRLASQAVESILPALFETYHLAINNKLIKPITNEARFALIETAFINIREELNLSEKFIENTLNSIKALSLGKDALDTLSIKEVINLALERFAFKDDKERSLVHVDIKKDYKFKGVAIFIPHIFFNLIKNALYYIHDSGKGEIFITAESGNDWNILYFLDTGPGMDDEIAKDIFNKKFVSRRTGGTGVGLAFCRQILLQCGGDITCESKKGEYTKFTIKFPLIEEDKS